MGLPSCLELEPECDFYVRRIDTNSILKCNGQTGAFLDVLIDDKNSDLDSDGVLTLAEFTKGTDPTAVHVPELELQEPESSVGWALFCLFM